MVSAQGIILRVLSVTTVTAVVASGFVFLGDRVLPEPFKSTSTQARAQVLTTLDPLLTTLQLNVENGMPPEARDSRAEGRGLAGLRCQMGNECK